MGLNFEEKKLNFFLIGLLKKRFCNRNLSDSALPGIALNRLLNSSELPFYFSLTGAALSEMIVFVYVPTFMLTVLYSVNTVRIVHRCKKNSIWIPLLPQQDICLPAGGQTKNIFTELSFSFPLFALQIDA